MPSKDDVQFGEIALKNRLITKRQHDDAITQLKMLEGKFRKQGKKKKRPRLVDVLVQKDYINGVQAKSIENARVYRTSRVQDKLYGRIALKSKFCKAKHIEKGLEAQKASYLEGEDLVRLADYLLDKNYLTEEEDEAIQDALGSLDADEYMGGRRKRRKKKGKEEKKKKKAPSEEEIESEEAEVEELDLDDDIEELGDDDLEELDDDDEGDELDDSELDDSELDDDDDDDGELDAIDLDAEESAEALDDEDDVDEIDSDIEEALSSMEGVDLDLDSGDPDAQSKPPRGLSSDEDSDDLKINLDDADLDDLGGDDLDLDELEKEDLGDLEIDDDGDLHDDTDLGALDDLGSGLGEVDKDDDDDDSDLDDLDDISDMSEVDEILDD